VQNIAQKASQPGKSTIATIIGVALALLRKWRVRQLKTLEYDWGVKAKPARGIGISAKPLSLISMVAGICFLLLVSLAIEALLKGFSRYAQSVLPGGLVVALTVYPIFDFAVVVLLFAMIFKVLPDIKIQWRERLDRRGADGHPFRHWKMAAGFYLGSGARFRLWSGHSLITLLLWFYYSSQILLFAVNSRRSMRRELSCIQANRIRGASGDERSGEALAWVGKTSKVSPPRR